MTTLAVCSCSGPRGGIGPVIVLAAMAGAFLLGQWLWWKFALKGWFCMKNVMKIVAVVTLVLAVGVVLAVKRNGADSTASNARKSVPSGETDAAAAGIAPLPRLVSLGAGKCVPCKMMEPIREELQADYADRLQLVYHDVWQDRAAGERYGIRLIPTLIYFDAQGNELGRTEGYRTKEQILQSFRQWGVELDKALPGNAPAPQPPTSLAPSDFRIQFAAAPVVAPVPSEPPMTLVQAHPLLGQGALSAAKLVVLSDGVLVRAGDVVINSTDLQAILNDAQPEIQAQLKQNQLFILEQVTTQRLLVAEARRALTAQSDAATTSSDDQILDRYLRSVAEGVKVSEPDILAFYQANAAMMGGAPLEDVKGQIGQYLLDQARQAFVSQHVKALVGKADIQLDATWVAAQAKLAIDNPVDRARASGRPAMIDFGSHGCGPCDMMTPILEHLSKTYDGRAHILFVPVNEHQILAARYGVQGIPTQIFFDANGREVHRHTGFLAQDKIESQLSQMGVR